MIQNVRFALSLYGNFGEYEERILEAINKISRIFFVENAEIAYLDTALPIGEGQTISQPSTVARMLQLLELKHGEEVLEIGAGSGWNACLIAYLVKPGKILSLERHEKLIGFAKRNLRKTQIKNVKFYKSLNSFRIMESQLIKYDKNNGNFLEQK